MNINKTVKELGKPRLCAIFVNNFLHQLAVELLNVC